MESPTRVDIDPQDDENGRAIIAKIRAENIRNESTIRAIVDRYEFSSKEAKQHTADRMVDLLNMGAFDQPEPKTIHIDAVDTDARI